MLVFLPSLVWVGGWSYQKFLASTVDGRRSYDKSSTPNYLDEASGRKVSVKANVTARLGCDGEVDRGRDLVMTPNGHRRLDLGSKEVASGDPG